MLRWAALALVLATVAAPPPPSAGDVAVAVAAAAAAPEQFAAQQLAHFLSLVAGTAVPVLTPTAAAASGRPTLAVGAAASLAFGVPRSSLSHAQLADDGYHCATAPGFKTVTLSGALRGNSTAPRGTVNAVFAYLRSLGFKFLAPNVTLGPGPLDTVPPAVRLVRCDGVHTPSYGFRLINPSFLLIGDAWPVFTDGAPPPTLEGTALFWVANHFNGAMDGELPPLPAQWGGSIGYSGGFVHTIENYIPFAQYNVSHPEWYGGAGQPCWSNASLVGFLVTHIRSLLAGSPAARGDQVIVSVSQNDLSGSGKECAAYPDGLCYCNTPAERAIIKAEGTPMGPMLRAVNQIAATITDEFPSAAIETLAYGYTVHPPRLTRPRSNVLITFCTMADPLVADAHALPITDPVNRGMRSLLGEWSRIMPNNRIMSTPDTASPGGLRVWDYVENFDNYMMPFPNWRTVGQNLQHYSSMGVSSYFGESDHGAGHIAEMSELRAWVQSSMLWDVSLDPSVLVDEFVLNYYGEVAHTHVLAHIEGWETGLQAVANWTDALSHGGFMSCGADALIHPGNCYQQPWVTMDPVLRSATELTAALAALGSEPMNAPYARRVEKVLLSSWWIILMRWEEACAYANVHSLAWPLHRNMTVSLSDWIVAAAQHEIVSLCDSIPGFTVQSYNDTPTAGKVCDVTQPPPRHKTDDADKAGCGTLVGTSPSLVDDEAGTFTFGTSRFAMTFDRSTLLCVNVTACSADGRQQGFLWPGSGGLDRFSLWQLSCSDCSVVLPDGSRLDALNSTVAAHNFSISDHAEARVLTLQWLGVTAEPAGTTMDVTVTVTMSNASAAQAALRGSIEVYGQPVCVQSLTLPNFERLVLRSPSQDKLFTPWFYGQVGDQSELCGGGDCTLSLDSLDINGASVRYRGLALMPNGNERAMQWAALYSSPSPSPAPPLGLYIAAHSPRSDLMMLLMKGKYCTAHAPEPAGFSPNHYSVNATLHPGLDNGMSGGELPHHGQRFSNYTGCAKHCGENRMCRSWTWNDQTHACYPKPKVGVFSKHSSTAAHDVSGCSPGYPASACVDSPPPPPAPGSDCGSAAGLRWLHFPENSLRPTRIWSMWYDVVLAGFDGDWWDAAMIYREWVLNNAVWTRRCNLTIRAAKPGYPQWLLKTPLWGAVGGAVSWQAENMRLAAELGTPVGTQWYLWETQAFDHNCKYTNPVMTPKPGFAAAVGAMQAANPPVHVSPYTTGSLMEPQAAKNIADHTIDFACHGHDGKPLVYTLPDQLIRMDPSSKYWQQAVANTTKQVADAGTDGVYLDQTASYYASMCFQSSGSGSRWADGNRSNGSSGGGSRWADGNRAIFEASVKAAGPQKAIISESNAEAYMGSLHAYLAIYGFEQCGVVPGFQAVYGGWSIRVGAKDWPTDQPSIRMLLAQQWTYGHVMGRADPKTFLNNNHTLSFTRQLAQLKVNHSEYLVYGRLMHPLVLTNTTGGPLRIMRWAVGYPAGKSCDSPVALAQVWMASDGSLGLTLANPSNESQYVRAALRVDGHTHLAPGAQASVDGVRAQAGQTHLSVTKTMPPLSAAIVRISHVVPHRAIKTDDFTRWPAGSGFVHFNPVTASLVGLEHPHEDPWQEQVEQPISLVSPGCLIFAVRLWPAENQPLGNASKPGDGWEVSESVAIPDAQWQLSNSTTDRQFVYTDNATGLVATLSAVAVNGSPLKLLMSLHNTGHEVAFVAELIFPRLCGLVAPSRAELVSSGGPRGTGLRTTDPIHNINDPQLQWFEYGYDPYLNSDSYPHSMMNWLALSSPAEALYIGVHDPVLRVTALRAKSHVANSSIRLAFAANATVPLPPHATSPGQHYIRPAVLSFVRSAENSSYAQWHQAAKIYRQWLESALVPVSSPRHPDWLRQGFTGLDLSGDFPQQFYGERETEIDAPWFYGLEILNLWGHASNPQCCPGFPCPDPGRGGGEGFKAYVTRLQSSGIRVGTYFEAECANPVFSNATSFRGQQVDTLPPAQRPPQLEEMMTHAAMLAPAWAHNHNGNLQPGPTGRWGMLPGNYERLVTQIDEQTGGFEDVGAYVANSANGSDTHYLLSMHYSADGWFQDYLGGWLEFYGGEMGTDTPYLDQLGFFPTGPDFAESGMLPAFGDGDAPRRILNFLQTVATKSFPRQISAGSPTNHTEASVAPFFFTYEGYTDSYGAAGGGALLSGHREIPCREICDDFSPLMESRCALCTQKLPWITNNATGIVAAFEVARATFPQHAVFEGTCNVGTATPIALHAVAHGFCDGHKSDLTSHGSASTLGFLSPLVWLREGIAPWIQSKHAEYFFDVGVVAAPSGWIVRQHRGVEMGATQWSMFLYNSPDAAAGRMTVDVMAESNWYLIESSGDCRVLGSCAGQRRCTVDGFHGKESRPMAAAVGAVLAVRLGASSLPSQSLLLLRLELPEPNRPELVLSVVNVGTSTLNWTLPIVEHAGGTAEPGIVPVSIPCLRITVSPNSSAYASASIDMSRRSLPARLVISWEETGASTLANAHRLAPVPIADPHFSLRQFASGTTRHPEANSTANRSRFAMQLRAVGGKLTSAYRHVYWPADLKGIVHIRMKALAGGAPDLPVPMNGLVQWWPRNASHVLYAALCVFRPAPSMGWTVGKIPFVGLANMSWLPLTLAMAGGPVQIPGLLQRNATLLVDQIDVLPVGVTPAWLGAEPPIACSPE